MVAMIFSASCRKRSTHLRPGRSASAARIRILHRPPLKRIRQTIRLPRAPTRARFLGKYSPSPDETQNSASSSQNSPQKSSSEKKVASAIVPTSDNNLVAMLGVPILPLATLNHPVPALTLGKSGAASDGNNLVPVVESKATASTSVAQDSSPNIAAQSAEAISKILPPAAGKLDAALKPSDGAPPAAKDSPPNNAEPVVSPTIPADESKSETQVSMLQTVASMAGGASLAVAGAGTSAALDTQRMKSSGQKNESAGRTVQKLPHATSSGTVSTGSATSAMV